MLKFVTKDNKTDVLSSEGGIMLGYIDENNIFFPNNNMMFKVEWMLEIARYMQIQGEIPLPFGITAQYAALEETGT